MPRAMLVLNTKAYLVARGWPALVGAVGGPAVDAAFLGWRTLALRGDRTLTIEDVQRFDSRFDVVTQRCMSWHGFWPPHDADFLNWRYLDHPAGNYAAFALLDKAQLAGYSVLRTDSRAAWLMEFAAPSAPRLASTLLQHSIEAARAAGCACLMFSASPRWRHWPLFRSAGFLPIRSQIFLWPGGEAPELRQLDLWQWVPGDMDDL